MKLFGDKKTAEDRMEEEILSIVEENHEQGVIEDSEAELISNIFEFSDKVAKDVMTNRQKICAMELPMTVSEALRFALDNQFSRFPVYEEDLDNIKGIVHLRGLIESYLDHPHAQLADILDDAKFIHPTYDIGKLLEDMQREKTHMSIVVDEYGQTDGLVTMEDIIEEIVGNISDEYDEITVDMKELSDGSFIMKGEAELVDVSDALGIDFPDEDIDTLNGFLLYKLGHLPKDEEEIEILHGDYLFVPARIKDNMIKLVRVKKVENKE